MFALVGTADQPLADILQPASGHLPPMLRCPILPTHAREYTLAGCCKEVSIAMTKVHPTGCSRVESRASADGVTPVHHGLQCECTAHL